MPRGQFFAVTGSCFRANQIGHGVVAESLSTPVLGMVVRSFHVL